MRAITIILLFITGLNALTAGYGFIADPSGEGVGISTAYLKFSFFDNFLIPGIILFVAVGLVSIVAAIFALLKIKIYPLLIFTEGCILTGWIIIQVMLVRDFNWLHFTFLGIGLLLIFFGKKMTNGKIVVETK